MELFKKDIINFNLKQKPSALVVVAGIVENGKKEIYASGKLDDINCFLTLFIISRSPISLMMMMNIFLIHF